jgi:hypothetical protein
MKLKFSVGDLTIHRIIEQETTFLQAQDMLPDLTPDMLAENRAWMKQIGALDDTDTLILCFQSYIVQTPNHTVLIDSCIGNDKPRPSRPQWNMKTDDSYMRALAACGFSVADIDFVMCTHLHVNHVGWNTRLENGRWVPTFPNARYVFAKSEYDYWFHMNAKTEVPPFVDSVLPVVEAKKADIVINDFVLGDHARILPTPGHTPAMSRSPSAAARMMLCSPAISCTRRYRRAIRNCRRNSTSIGSWRLRRAATSCSAIATPTRCAAPRISPRRRQARSAAGAMGLTAR